MTQKILIAILDWGLGHACRCLPLIQYFLEKGAKVHLASSGNAGMLLRQEFPALDYHPLPSYNINYSNTFSLSAGIALQLPAIFDAVRREHETLEEICKKEGFTAIVSDNRYGCYHRTIKSVFLSHQLGIQSPILGSVTNSILRIFHFRMIRSFQYCWIPDFPGSLNLSGALSHGFRLPKNTFFIGPLNRFEHLNHQDSPAQNAEVILAVLSGPEPQRSLLESILEKQFNEARMPLTLVRGVMTENPVWVQDNSIRKISYIASDQLYNIITSAKLIICRSGYTSIMDLAFTGKKAILVATPGQTEQEYLARYHKLSGHYYSESQRNFNLQRSLHKSLSFSGLKINPSNDLLDAAFEKIICD